MSVPAHSGLARWLAGERRWKGENALVPVDTCYQILNRVSWVLAAVNLFMLAMTARTVLGPLSREPLYWIFCLSHVAMVPVAIFRGWAFNLRVGIMMFDFFASLALVGVAVGLSPSWAFIVVVYVALASLFYGSRVGMWVVAAILLLHLGLAWGWVSGRLPILLTREQSAALLSLSSPVVWTRVLVVCAGYLVIVVSLVRYVLSDLNKALRSATSTLNQLALEQEHRARAEQARFVAERSAREAQKFEALGRLASGVAHDFNNALCVTKCWSTYLLEVSDDAEVKSAMREIKSSTENAEHLTQHLLAFSRSETGKREASDLTAAVEQECKTLRRLLPKNIEVTDETSGPAIVPLGKGQIQEIILNLAINARDAMPEGGRLTIQAGITELTAPRGNLQPGRYARLTVTDTGIGMDEATLAKAYEPFFTTKPEGKGTGLGLSMVFGLVSGARGSIQAESTVGKGTTFSILLPVLAADVTKHFAALPPAAVPRRCKVLVLDSKPEIGALVEKILNREGFTAHWVKSAAAAVLALEESRGSFELLVVQGVTSGMSTQEIIDRARDKNPNCGIVVMSAPSMEQEVMDGVIEGLYHLLAKPFESEGLRGVVAKAMSPVPGPSPGVGARS